MPAYQSRAQVPDTCADISSTCRTVLTRRPCPQDRRGQIAALTDAGRGLLEHTAPGHVAQVRATVLDPLTPDEVHQLSTLLAKIVTPLEAEDARAHGAIPPVAP